MGYYRYICNRAFCRDVTASYAIAPKGAVADYGAFAAARRIAVGEGDFASWRAVVGAGIQPFPSRYSSRCRFAPKTIPITCQR